MTQGYRAGSGERLLLLHGGGGSWVQWRPVIPLLEPRHEVLAVNLMGHWGGEPVPPGAEVSLDLVVDAAERDLESAGWSSAHVAGTSLGGLVALELAKRGRDASCTAMATIPTWKPGGDWGLRLVARSYGLFHRVTSQMARDPGRWSRRPRLRRLLYWHHFARPERMDPVLTAQLIVGFANSTILPGLFDWAVRHEGPGDFDRIRCPVQVLFPERDLVFPPRRYRSAFAEALPQAELRDLPGVGHVATWDDPELVANAIGDFTSRHAAARESA